MKEALALCDEILTYEPTNRIVLEYQPALREYIKQGKFCVNLNIKLSDLSNALFVCLFG